jgi:methionyl-tRNA formyltransferase
VALRLVFMGTPDFAVPTLVELVGGGHDIAAVYTRAPQPAGRRGLETTPSPIAREAERLKLPTVTPRTLKDEGAADAMRAHGADAAIVVAYGLILPKATLDSFPLGCFNLHASLLPRWRGAAPIHRAIMAGDKETGVMVMKMEEGLDTGPIARSLSVTITPDETTGELNDRLAQLGPDLMILALAKREMKKAGWKRQSSTDVTYAAKIDKNETRVDWTKSSDEVHNHCRGLSPFPGAWCEMPIVGRVKILRTTKGDGSGEPGRILDDRLTVACGSGAVRIVELQRAGGKPMAAEEFLRGTPIAPASVLP